MSDPREERLERLSGPKRALFERLKGRSRAGAITPRPPAAECPLSIAQESLWFIERLSPGTPAFNVPAAVRVHPGLDAVALEAALGELGERHEVLRTRFASREGRPFAVFDPAPLTLERRRSPTLRDAEQEARALAARPFDLARERLLRVTLLDTDDGHQVLSIVAHHAITDGRSIDVFFAQLGEAYERHVEAAGSSPAPAPPRPPLQYGDFAHWERGKLAAGGFAEPLAHWTQALAGGCPELQLPTRADAPRPTRASETVRFRIPPPIVAALTSLGGRHDATLFVVLLAVWKATFFTWSRQQVLVVGMPVKNRGRPELEDMLGMFTTTTVLRTTIEPLAPFSRLLTEVRAKVLDALEHQDLPFSKLVEALRPARTGRETPLVRATVWLRPTGGYDLRLRGVSLAPIEVETGVATYDFSVVMWERDGGVDGTVTVPAQLFGPGVVEAMVDTFSDLAREVAGDAERSLRALTERTHPAITHEPTDNQRLVWMGTQVHKGLPVYNEALRATVHGALDPDGFARAWREVVQSTDALRARVQVSEGRPSLQILEPRPDDDGAAGTVELEVIDLSSAADPAQAWALETRAWIDQPIDLAVGLGRAVLARLGPSAGRPEPAWGIYLSLHQIGTDGWSFQRLFERLDRAYRAVVRPEDRQPPARTARLADFMERDRRYQTGPESETARAYWLAKTSQTIDLPALYGQAGHARPRPVQRVPISLTRETEQALRALAGRREYASFSVDLSLMTLSLTLLSAYVLRVSDAESFAVAVPFHNRTDSSNADVVGLVMTVCPILVDGSGQPTFRSLFDQLLREIRGTLPHTRLVNANSPARPTYSVMLNYQSRELANFAGLPAQVDLQSGSSKLESLTLDVVRNPKTDRLELSLHVDAGLVATVGAETIAAHLQALLAAMLAAPETEIAAVPIATTRELELAHAASRQLGPAPFRSVVDRLEARVRATPDAVALVDGARQRSYAALWRRAAQIAHAVRQSGLGREATVALRLDDGIERVAAILGALRAGVGYLALAPNVPAARTREILDDARAGLLVTDADADGLDTPVLSLPALGPDAEALGTHPPIHPAQAAYVLFTSGSTGRPKGVVITHEGLAAFTASAEATLSLSASDRVLQFADVSFDTSLEEILPTLLAGGALVVRPSGLLDSPRVFWRTVDEQALSVVDLPSSLWHVLGIDLTASKGAIPSSLSTVIIGGEQGHTVAWQQWATAARRTTRPRPLRLINTYGPTETTVAVTAFEAPLDPPLKTSDAVPIGRARTGTDVVALTARFAVPPVAVPGDLFVIGPQVARGYLGRPAETADRFGPDPRGTTGGRAYRTGDRAYLSAAGDFVYAGRRDRQVKLNGYRVELDEIEAQLRRVPGVASAAVYRSDHGELAAAYVGREEVTADIVRQALARALPSYMIPSAIHREDSLPLDWRGKVDYRKLESTRRVASESRVQSRTEVESVIAAIWSELLDLRSSDFGVTDNFFQLGGHSLLGTQLMARLEREFRVELPLVALFDAPTIEGLANTIGRLAAKPADDLDALVDDLEGLSPEELAELMGEVL